MHFSALITAVALLLMLSGCSSGGTIYSNYREIEDILLVLTMGIDGRGRDITLSVSTGTGMEEGSEPVKISTRGNSITDAMETLHSYSSRSRPFYAHVKYIILGHDAAGDVSGCLDYAERSTELRLDANMFIVKDGNAKSLITAENGKNYDISAVLTAMERDTELTGYSHVYTFKQVAQRLAEYGSALVCAVEYAESEGTVFPDQGPIALPAGYAVLKGSSLCCFLSDEEVYGTNVLLNQIGTCSVTLPAGENETVTVALTNSSSKLKPEWKNGKPALTADISLRAGIVEMSDNVEITNQNILDMLNEELSEIVRIWCRSAVKRSQDTGADFLMLGGCLRRDDPKKFRAIEEQWPEMLKDIEFSVNVDAVVARTYDIIDPVDDNGGGFRDAA